MDSDYSFEALTDFLKYVADHGLWKANTAVSYRSAAAKVEGDLTEQEAADVQQIDLDLLFQRYTNRNKLKVSPSTLATYKRRLGSAISEFVRYRQDPINYRPEIGSQRKGGDGGDSATKKPRRTTKKKPSEVAPKEDVQQSSMGMTSSTPMLTIPFPLRPDFLASIQIPRDLRKTEAERLAAFIKTLAMDAEVG